MTEGSFILHSRHALMLKVLKRLANRPDTEHEQAIVRLALVSLTAVYFLPDALSSSASTGPHDALFAWSLAVLIANSAAILGLILARPAASVPRRVYGIFADIGAVSYFLALSGLKGLPLLLLFVWISIANGFRFGPRYLLLSLGMTALGFGIVLLVNPWWVSHTSIGMTFLLVTVTLGAYILKLVRKLYDAVARAEAANVAKRRFVSNISHEMRTPLNAVVNLSQLLSQTDLRRDQRDLLDTLSGASNVLMQLVNDVLDFSKIEAGKLQIEHIPFDLHAFVNSTSRMFQPQAELKGLRIQVNTRPEVPHALIGDPHHLRQVLMNLMGNAIKFTERGHVALEITALAETERDVRLRFAVRDTGIGMNRQAAGRVFESFSQAEASISRKYGGTGLGTTIAKQLVELMGGRIGVESVEGEGTTFWFELPLAKSVETEQAAANGNRLHGTILLMTTNPALLGRVRALFGGADCVVDPIQDIGEAVKKITSEQRSVACVLVEAAEISQAHAIAAAYHAQTARNRPPLALCIDRVSPSERSTCLSVGYSAIIETPWPDRLVQNAVRAVIASESGGLGEEKPPVAGAESVGCKILVVDDTKINLIVAKLVLERAGHRVTCVESGEEALAAMEREQYGYDLVVSDLHMPGMDGLVLTRSLRVLTRGMHRRLPIIMLTADVTPEARAEVLASGADVMLGKPINAKELNRTIESLWQVREQEGDARRAAPSPDAGPPAMTVERSVLSALADMDEGGALLARIISRYDHEIEQALEKCRAAADASDSNAFNIALDEIIVHGSGIGARSLMDLCRLLQRHAQDARTATLPALIERLERACNAIRVELVRYREERSDAQRTANRAAEQNGPARESEMKYLK